MLGGIALPFVGRPLFEVHSVAGILWVHLTLSTVPIMVILMMMTVRSNIMGEFTIRGWFRALGWLSTGAMAFCVVGMGITSFL